MAENPPAGWQAVTREDGPGWERTVRFASFAQAVGMVTAIMVEAERANHHPDVEWSWTRVRLRLISHDQGTVTERDRRLAERINALLDAKPAAD